MDLSTYNNIPNITKNFYFIYSKNLPGKLYAKAAPGF